MASKPTEKRVFVPSAEQAMADRVESKRQFAINKKPRFCLYFYPVIGGAERYLVSGSCNGKVAIQAPWESESIDWVLTANGVIGKGLPESLRYSRLLDFDNHAHWLMKPDPGLVGDERALGALVDEVAAKMPPVGGRE